MTADDVNPYPEFGQVHIQQALSLVPEAVIEFFDLDTALYLKQEFSRFAVENQGLDAATLRANYLAFSQRVAPLASWPSRGRAIMTRIEIA